jgi:hypothetical protein
MKELTLAQNQFRAGRLRPNPEAFIIGIVHSITDGARLGPEEKKPLLVDPLALIAEVIAPLVKSASEEYETGRWHGDGVEAPKTGAGGTCTGSPGCD